MAEGLVNIGTNVGGVSRSKPITRTGTCWAHPEPLEAGQAGTLSTRTGDDAGILSVDSHGILNTDTVDVGWVDVSGLNQYRANMTVSSVTTDTLTVAGGSGTNFPVEDYDVVVGKRMSVAFSATGSAIELISLYSAPPAGKHDSRVMVDFVTSLGATIKACDLNDDEPFVWVNNSPIANPVAGGAIAALEMSSLCEEAPTVYVEIVYDASP